MKKILLGILAFAAVACNNDEVVYQQTSSAITFGDSFVEVKTRANESIDPSTTTDGANAINEFDVWAFINNDPTGTVFNKERVERDGGVWKYGNTQWWASAKNYDFFAVSPVDDANIVVDNSTMNEYGLGNIAFTNVDGTTDLLYAAKELKTDDTFPYYEDKVSLQFMHLLSKIKFTFKNGFTSEHNSLMVTNIKISGAPLQGNIDVNKQQRTDYKWALVDGQTTELSFGDANVNDVNGKLEAEPIAIGQKGYSQYERLTIPAEAGYVYTISFDLALYNGTQEGATCHKEIILDNQAFEIGKNYNLVATIDASNFEDLTPIEFDAIEVLPWIPADAEALDTPKVTATVKENNVTLAWEAIANAEKYSVAIGNQAPVFVDTTTYTFTGEYETEYTFTVVAIPADNSEYTNSADAIVTVTTEAKAAAVASEWGIVGDLTNWGTNDVKMYNTETENLFVAKNVELKSGSFKIRANNKWDDTKNYGFEVPGKAYADKYYAVITSGGSQNITPMEYGTYDVYFDLAKKRVALMTPGKAYAEAEDGGKPLVVVEGLKEHEWGVVGSFNNWDVANYVTTVVDGDWAVAKNIALTKNAEFKFAADKAWTLSYGSACDVVADKIYNTYNNGGNMKFVGEAGNYDIYFSLVSAEFRMTAAASAPAPVALATPVVNATVNANNVTLTWEPVENADKYSVTVGTEMPVFVEETNYTFVGEYETEYTFAVVAVPADETAFTASEAGVATATTEAEPVVGPTYTTVAEFLAAAEDESATAPMYTLKGTITAVANTSYGNFDLTDDTGTVYIYGLNSPDGATKQYWATSGAKIGDDIVIKTVRTSFNGTPQGKNAWFVELVSPGTRAFYTVDPAAVDFASAGGEQDIEVFAYNTTAGVTATSDNSAFTVDVNGYVVTVTAAANDLEEAVNGNITIKVGDLEATVVKATIAAKPAAGVVEGGSDDFNTITNTNTSYVTGKTTAGWNYKNCAIFKGGTSDSSPAFKMIGDASNRALCMNGKTSAVGSITSPTLTTGCGTLKFNYGLPFSDNQMKFRVDIMQDGAVVKTFTVTETSASKYTKYSHEEVINVAGDFQIVFTNLSPSNSTSNKDRTAIWDVEWTGYQN